MKMRSGASRLIRTVVSGLVLVALVAVMVAVALARPAAADAGKASLVAYRGLGSWVDIYESRAWNDPAAAVADMARHGVRTLYIETANYRINTALYRKAALNVFIEEAHARGMYVVAWYLPSFRDPDRDLRRSKAAINYRTPGKQRFDSFALDIEDRSVKPASLRNKRVAALSRDIRAAVGTKYPLGGIIPSPVALEWNPPYWPDFPYKMVADVYDVIVPMGYYTFHGDGTSQAYNETLKNVSILRSKTGDSRVPIHVIGGVGDKSTAGETRAYVRALREMGCLGGSMYNWSTTDDADWRALQNVRFNPRQRPALPVAVGYAAPLGNCRQDTTHPKEVFYTASGQKGDRVLRLRLWDVQANEVRLIVNWRKVLTFTAGRKGAWTKVRKIRIPAKLLRANGRNVIGIVARGDAPDWQRWGVRDLRLVAK
ncbi:MAG TPA: hypothetical protein VMY39_01220 [Planctomycetota bacterium]|nr:hypothetical protein [Planctomycetota bacterium]